MCEPWTPGWILGRLRAGDEFRIVITDDGRLFARGRGGMGTSAELPLDDWRGDAVLAMLEAGSLSVSAVEERMPEPVREARSEGPPCLTYTGEWLRARPVLPT